MGEIETDRRSCEPSSGCADLTHSNSTQRTWDRNYWGENGPDLSRWGHECARGLDYHRTGAAVASGTPGQVRKISVGRKTCSMASDDLKLTPSQRD